MPRWELGPLEALLDALERLLDTSSVSEPIKTQILLTWI
jgi:hypothetical protein